MRSSVAPEGIKSINLGVVPAVARQRRVFFRNSIARVEFQREACGHSMPTAFTMISASKRTDCLRITRNGAAGAAAETVFDGWREEAWQ